MKRKEMKQLLEERIERISLLETRIDTMEQLVDGYRAREQSIIETLHTVKETAAKTVEDGKVHANAMLSEAKRRANEALADAQVQATTMIEEASRRAKEALATAQSESERMLQGAEATKREYEQMVKMFNTALEQSAEEAEQSASRYAEFIKGRRITSPKMFSDEGGRRSENAAAREKPLPDPEGDPARLMQNIYQLQNRPLPENVTQEKDANTDADMKTATAEPAAEKTSSLPKHARAEEADPDYLHMFDRTYSDAAATARNDDIFGMTGAGSARSETPRTEPEPFSESAWGNMEHQSPSEPQAEFTAAFDTNYPETDFSLMPDPECAVPKPESAKTTAPAPEQPNPFSEEAWKHLGESASEPQAEFARAFASANETQTVPESDFSIDDTAEFAANYEANFEAAVSSADDEQHEWEPDPGEVPSVGELLPDSAEDGGDDMSLDDLLNEIIKAGE